MRKKHVEPEAAAEPGKIFTIAELATRWRVSHHTVAAAIRAGRLVGFKVGTKHYRVRGVEVLRFEQQQNLKAAS